MNVHLTTIEFPDSEKKNISKLDAKIHMSADSMMQDKTVTGTFETPYELYQDRPGEIVIQTSHDCTVIKGVMLTHCSTAFSSDPDNYLYDFMATDISSTTKDDTIKYEEPSIHVNIHKIL